MENLDCITFSTWCLLSVQAPVFDIGFEFLRFWTLSNSITSSCLLNPDPSVSSMNNCLRTNHFSLNYSTLSALYFLCPIRTFQLLITKNNSKGSFWKLPRSVIHLGSGFNLHPVLDSRVFSVNIKDFSLHCLICFNIHAHFISLHCYCRYLSGSAAKRYDFKSLEFFNNFNSESKKYFLFFSSIRPFIHVHIRSWHNRKNQTVCLLAHVKSTEATQFQFQ